MKPAILGGPIAVTYAQREALRWPIITAEDEQAVLEVLRHGDLSFDRVTQELEHDWCAFIGMRHALAHCYGTAGTSRRLFCARNRTRRRNPGSIGDLLGFCCPMLRVGAVPIFCESEAQRLGIDPADVERKIIKRTRAIVLVHLFGMPSRMEELMALAHQHGLK